LHDVVADEQIAQFENIWLPFETVRIVKKQVKVVVT